MLMTRDHRQGVGGFDICTCINRRDNNGYDSLLVISISPLKCSYTTTVLAVSQLPNPRSILKAAFGVAF